MKLPNGLLVKGQSKPEVDALYREIFVDEQYAIPKDLLAGGGCVVDVGANIGMFALYAQLNWQPRTILCVEPVPPIRDLLRANVIDLPGVVIEESAAGDRSEKAILRYYPHCTVMSGRNTDAAADAEAIEAMLEQRASTTGATASESVSRGIRALAQYALSDAEDWPAEVEPLCSMLDRHQIAHVDLLKIDVEGDELRAIAGLEDRAKDVAHILMELDAGRVARSDVESWLVQRGFKFTVLEPSRSAPRMVMIHAWR